MTDDIRIADAYENNLKHVSLTIPKGKLVVFAVAVARIVSCGVAERKAPAENKLREALLKANEVAPSTKTGEPR